MLAYCSTSTPASPEPPCIVNRAGEVMPVRRIRQAIMARLRLMATVYTLRQRQDAVAQLLADPAWLRRCNGQYLGATARDGFDACLDILERP